MVRVNDFVDANYDRKLAEFKAEKARRIKEMQESGEMPRRN
jgi:hypothetical protein